MDIKQLKYFVTAAEKGTISAAARELGISQPPLSTKLRLLEEELDCKLFERGARKITLTKEGKLFYERSKLICSLSETAVKEIDNFKADRKRSLRLGTTSTLNKEIIEKYIEPFKQKNPNVVFEIHEGNTFQLLDSLNDSVVDFAILRTPFSGQNLIMKPIEKEKMSAVAKPEAFLGLPEVLKIEDLKDKPLNIYRRMEPVVIPEFEKLGIKPNISSITDDARSAILWSNLGKSIAVVPCMAWRSYSSLGLESRIIENPSLETNLVFVYKKDAKFSELEKEFADCF